MTVEEQSAISTYSQKPRDNDKYDKIREVTGIEDRNLINRAIKACQDSHGEYELCDVIDFLLREPPATRMAAGGERRKATPTTVPRAASPPNNVSNVIPSTVSQGVGTSDTDPAFIGPKNKPGTGVIDLTADSEQDQLQKAIEESLRDNPGILGGQVVSQEEQEISRVLEQSLQENKAGTKRKRGDLWFVDPLNPHERKRTERWPVGLKNVGNTCWFSAVIQSLFHLLVFRRLVLHFVSPKEAGDESVAENVTARRNLRFMQELRRLFSLMVDSKRKYVDPSKAVEILKEGFVNASGVSAGDSQQDVSEFQHKLLEWLEDAFRSDQSRPSSPAHGASGPSSPRESSTTMSSSSATDRRPVLSNNPMIQLFYGQYLAEGVNEGQSFCQKETFGQFPLQVDGFRDIHESLEAATAQGEIEAVSSEVTQKSGQEQWFTCLPPVLTFELSRFQFNQQLGRPEKIHNKLEFPQIIHMDRYLEINKSITRQKREEVKRIKDDLKQLQAKLDRFINYGSGPKRFPLQDVLQYALEFAESKQHVKNGGGGGGGGVPTINVTDSSDVEMESPKSHMSMVIDSPTHTIPDVTITTPSPTRTPTKPSFPQSPTKTPTPLTTPTKTCGGNEDHLKEADRDENEARPSPKHVSREELSVLQTCLRRWRTEVEADVKELQDSISGLQRSINNMYTDPSLRKCPYKLHAVLVHEGQAASGHYWAYVFSHSRSKWLKFNDITVSETSWQELCQDSFGGYHNASAYCLMYVDASKDDLLRDEATDSETGQSKSILPPDLEKYVNEDNAMFEKEIVDWDTRQLAKVVGEPATTEQAAAAGTSKKTASTSTALVPVGPAQIHVSLPQLHAKLCLRQTQMLIHRALKVMGDKNMAPKDSFQEACKEEAQRLYNQIKNLEHQLPRKDTRLHHILLYMLANGCEFDNVFKRIMVEQVSLVTHVDPMATDRTQKIYAAAAQELQSITSQATDEEETLYQKWHTDFNQYRKALHMFVTGVDKFHKESYVDSLPYFMYACDINDKLVQGNQPMKGLHTRLLGYYRKQCLLHVNEIAASHFETEEEDGSHALDLMQRLVLPCLTSLSASTSPVTSEDDIADVRNKWCMFLSHENLSNSKVEKLQEFLSRLFDPPQEVKMPSQPSLPSLPRDSQLTEQYEAVMDIAEKHGYIMEAMTPSTQQ